MTVLEKKERLALAERLSPARPEDIRRARELLGLSQAGLAAAAGVSRGNVGDWERGRNGPGPKALLAIARLLRESPTRAP